jgi:hypothetical protein
MARTLATTRRIDLPNPDLKPYSQDQIRFAAAAWPMRAAEELRSALIYRSLAQASRTARLPEVWTQRFEVVAREELGHARLCVVVGDRLGAARPVYDARPVRTRLATLVSPLPRAIALMLVEVAIGETVSLGLFRAGHRSAVEPLTRAVLGKVARDEARHGALGWAGLAGIWPEVSEAEREQAQIEATRGLGAMERQIALPALRHLDAGSVFPPELAALGVLDPEARVEAFYGAIEEVVLPRLNRLGLDGDRAWDQRYRA